MSPSLVHALTWPSDGADRRPMLWLQNWLHGHEAELRARILRRLRPDAADSEGAARPSEARRAQLVTLHLRTLAEYAGHPRGPVPVPSDIERHARSAGTMPGSTLSPLLHEVETVQSEVWLQLTKSLRDTRQGLSEAGRTAVLEHAAAFLSGYFQAVARRIALVYAERSAGSPAADRISVHDVLTRLLSGAIDQERAEYLVDYDFGTPHAAFVVWSGTASVEVLEKAAARLVDRAGPHQQISMRASGNAVFTWVSCAESDLRAALAGHRLPHGVHAAWGTRHVGVEGFRATHREALEARRIHVAAGRSGMVFFEDVAVVSLASRDLRACSDFVEREIGAVAPSADPSGRLLETLRIYLDERASPTRTGRRLNVHPNTVVKRIARVERLLARPVDPASLTLRLAVELAPLTRQAGAAADPAAPADGVSVEGLPQYP
ncbi:helix-turn-helix domain-containing protein [Nocardiopsis sp. CNT-189]|uniref:PucR family transcriptional regulator n=1 Tax=Nocardiopsis oceanisediminis TaxID=2816862 RepID=UPI003B2EBF5F